METAFELVAFVQTARWISTIDLAIKFLLKLIAQFYNDPQHVCVNWDNCKKESPPMWRTYTTRTHTHANTHAQTHMHAHTHTYIHANTHIQHTRTNTHTHNTRAQTHTCKHTCANTHAHTHIYTQTRTHTHTPIRTQTHTHPHTRAHTHNVDCWLNYLKRTCHLLNKACIIVNILQTSWNNYRCHGLLFYTCR